LLNIPSSLGQNYPWMVAINSILI